MKMRKALSHPVTGAAGTRYTPLGSITARLMGSVLKRIHNSRCFACTIAIKRIMGERQEKKTALATLYHV